MRKDKKSLAETHPEVGKQWHPTKNGDLSSFDLTKGSVKRVWWKCNKGNDHEWISTINNRTNGNGCPICSGRLVVLSNCLATINPELSKEWHSTKNGKLTPYNVSKNQTVWWKCKKGDDHVWKSRIKHRLNGVGCPICSGHKTVLSNCLETLNPELSKQWHSTKNGDLNPLKVQPGSGKKVWWKCEKGDDHEWKTSICDRSNGNGCPVCSGRVAVLSNCLETLNPELAKEWHPTKNGDLTALNVKPGSGKKVWWKCEKGDDHEWKTSIQKRTKSGHNCSICSGHKTVLSNCLETLNPKLAKEWHPTKNGDLTPFKITAQNPKKVWWQCSKNEYHEWKTSVVNRNYRGDGCPYCTLTPQSKQELTVTFELKMLFKNIDPKGLKIRLKGRLRSIDIFIPKLNLCIEFDGSYWHKNKRDVDKIKSEMLFKKGFSLIRVREEPLKKIYNTDVISNQPYDGKQVTNDILSMIINIFNLDNKLVTKIKDYQFKEGLQNEKGLDRYIDQILTEKSATSNN